MGTPVETIIDKFLKSIDDEILAVMEPTLIEDLLLTYLEEACADFEECKKELRLMGGYFTEDLTSMEQLIIAKAMIPHWLSPKIFREDNLKILISDSDYNQKSPANLLGQLKDLKKQAEYEVKVRKIKYSYSGMKEWF